MTPDSCITMIFHMRCSTYIKEGASLLQYELTGVWFILTVIYIDVEFISLGKKNRRRVSIHHHQNQKKYSELNANAHPGDEAVTHVLWQLLIVDELLQENAAKMEDET